MGLPRDDGWTAGEHYEPYVGRWSRRVAARFLDWLALPAGLAWVDVGCGTGALTEAISKGRAPRSVIGVDPSAGFVAYARRRLQTDETNDVRFEIADARSLPLASASVDAAVSGLVLNFVPEPGAAVREMARVTRPGGTVAAYVWDYAEKMELMRWFWDAAVALDPATASLDEGHRFPLCRPDPLRALFASDGLAAIETEPIDIETRFESFDDYWTPFLGAQGPAPAYVATLSEDRRATLREALRTRLPHEADGSIRLTARAWAVRGTA